MNFEDFYGNENTKEYLNSVFSKDSIPHAFLFTGDRGSGKKMLANIVARALVCESDDKPCLKCSACQKAEHGTHPDISFIDADTLSKKTESIRELKLNALLRPNDADRKVYIIDNSGSLTHEAQDALLKILEEPPHFTFFILLALNTSELLPTIISRTTRISLSSLSDEELLKIIKKNFPDISDEEANDLIRTSGGVCSFLVEKQNDEALDFAALIAKSLISKDEFEIFKAFALLEKSKRDMLSSVLDEVSVILRDAIIITTNANSRPLSLLPSALSEKLASVYSSSQLSELSGFVAAAKNECIRNIGPSHITGNLTCKFAHTAVSAALKG